MEEIRLTRQRLEKVGLLQLLQKHRVPLELWGHGEAKTVESLLIEINEGESSLSEEDGGLVKLTNVAALNVFYQKDNQLFKLEEEKQVFTGGRERRRKLETSISEKIKPRETPQMAAQRALKEELGIEEDLALVEQPPLIKGPQNSTSYPGLMTKRVISVFDVFLTPNFFSEGGYREEQADKTNFYTWKSV